MARKQAVANPVSTDPESDSEGATEPTSPSEQPEEPMLLLDFEGPTDTPALSPEGTVRDHPVGGSELESRRVPSDNGGWPALLGKSD